MRHFNVCLYRSIYRQSRINGVYSYRIFTLMGDVRLNRLYYTKDQYGWEMIDEDDRNYHTNQLTVPMQFKKKLYG